MKRLLKILAVLILLVFVFWQYFWVGINSNKIGSDFNKNENAVWIGHQWVGEQKSQKEIENLVNNLDQQGIKTVFVHSGPLDADGLVDRSLYPEAKSFLETAKELNPEIEYQAWLGQIRSKIDLDNELVQNNVANQAKIMIDEVGFDGIHFDVEPVWDEDFGFIGTLAKTRQLLPEVHISVALAEFIPRAVIWATKGSKEWVNYNTEVNYQNVAEYADQIVVMVYDTGIKDQQWYRLLVREQTIWLSNMLDGKELFVGIASYEDETEDSDFRVENVKNGLLGVIDGLNNIRSDKDNFAGVAVYSYWETDEEEWEDFQNYWIK